MPVLARKLACSMIVLAALAACSDDDPAQKIGGVATPGGSGGAAAPDTGGSAGTAVDSTPTGASGPGASSNAGSAGSSSPKAGSGSGGSGGIGGSAAGGGGSAAGAGGSAGSSNSAPADAGTQAGPDAGTAPPGDSLVPAQGALLGVFYGADDLAATASKIGRMPQVHLTYYAWDDDWTGRITKADLEAGRIPLVNWEPHDPKLTDIAAGDYDDMLHQRAASAKALGMPFFLDWGAEMNGDWSPWGGAQNGMSAEQYLAAYKHIHDVFTADGVSNAIWLWCPNVTDEPRAAWNATLGYYPGDDYVDWACVDGYNWGSTQGGWQSFDDVFKDVYDKLATLNKPIMIGEMASAEAGGDKAAWIDAIIPTLRDQFPLIHGLVWFDINKETDWRISSSPAAEAAFKKMANDPYFNP
jgi:hypothetical protein